jgi:hypothetical protein
VRPSSFRRTPVVLRADLTTYEVRRRVGEALRPRGLGLGGFSVAAVLTAAGVVAEQASAADLAVTTAFIAAAAAVVGLGRRLTRGDGAWLVKRITELVEGREAA